MVTAGNRAPQVEFPSSVLPVLRMCTAVFAWFTPSLMDCPVWSQVIAFGGIIALQRFVHISDKKTPAILKWSSTILTVTHIYIYIFIYIHNYLKHTIMLFIPQELAALPKQLTNPTSGLAEFIGQNILTGLTSGISSISHCEKLSASFSSESRHSDSLKCSWKQ